MKKFISALSSFVIAASAMGGTFAMTANALYKDVVGGTNASTIIEVRADGVDGTVVNAKAGQKIPLSMYIPQSNGFHTISMKMSINGDETLGKGVEDHNGKKEVNEYSYGNYGIVLEPLTAAEVGNTALDAFPNPNCLESGIRQWDATKTAKREDKRKKDGAGDVGDFTYSAIVGDSMNLLFVADSLGSNGKNIDSNIAYQAAGAPDLSTDTYVGVTEWSEAEYKEWIGKTTELPFAKMNMVLPADLPNGTYKLTMVNEYVPYVAIWDKADKGVEPAKNPSRASGVNTVGGEDVDRKLEFRGITVQVGEGSGSSTTSATTTSATTSSATTSGSTSTGTTGGTTVTTEAVPADTQVLYQLAVLNKEYSPVVDVKPGEDVSVAFVLASDDPGTAGLKAVLDFSALTKAGGELGDMYNEEAYSGTAEFDQKKPDAVSFVIAASKEQKAQKGSAIFSIDVTMPTTEGQYTVKLGNLLDPVPLEGDSYKGFVQSVTFNVTNNAGSTTTTSATTTFDSSTTSSATTTTISTTSGTTTSATTTSGTTTSGTTTSSTTTTTTTTVKPGSLLLGDVNCNGAVTIADVVLLNKSLAGKKTLDETAQKNADANQNGTPDYDDSLLIREWLAGIKNHPTLGSLI